MKIRDMQAQRKMSNLMKMQKENTQDLLDFLANESNMSPITVMSNTQPFPEKQGREQQEQTI